ncbi:ABC transporter permease [Ornithinibacillus gellani]|uniref:ABC transporter permease n=1 Tax=Ornithinibacillus gellani TaxID=2293253 RepID=UPI00168106A3|nr:ABC transporter permease [Ornithinibacillus gellani]
MFHFGQKLLFARKRWLFLATFSIAIIMASTISIFTSSEAIKASLQENAYQLYGEHSGVLIGIDATKEEVSAKTDGAGQYQIVNQYEIDVNKTATIGWMDKDALQLGHIDLLEGSFPIDENEVAIESSYLYLIDPNWKVGEEKSLHLNNQDVNVLLTGIVRDYSAKWSVPYDLDIGRNDFPNIFISQKHVDRGETNFLFKFNGNKNKVEKRSREFLEPYTMSGFINQKLLFEGLIDFNTISTSAFIFQTLIIITSICCVFTLFSYLHSNQRKNIAVLRSVGAKKEDIFRIYISQSIIIFFFSLLLSLPLQVIFYHGIIKSSFIQNNFSGINIVFMITVITIWLAIIFFIILGNSIYSIRKIDQYSTNELRREDFQIKHLKGWIAKIKSFAITQFALQILEYPKKVILALSTVVFSILMVLFSIYLQNESAGIWEADEDYFLSASEFTMMDQVEHLDMLINKASFFSREDVEKLEKTSGISYINKTPFMMDIHPLISSNIVTPAIQDWIRQFNPEKHKYHKQLIIPHVKYVLINEQNFNELYVNNDYQDFKGKIIISPPSESRNPNDSLIGEHLSFVRKSQGSGEEITTQEWTFEVYDVISGNNSNLAFLTDQSNALTIIMDEQTAFDHNLLPGYLELTIFTDDALSNKDAKHIDELIQRMSSLMPGSLYQNLNDFREEDTKISFYVGYLGKLAYAVSITLTVISIIVIFFSKYQSQKRRWGIYLSLGMTRKQVFQYLILEMIIYIGSAIVISLSIFLIAMKFLEHLYPIPFYLKYYCFVILFLYTLLLIGSIVLNKVMKRQSIFSMIRVED